MIYALNFVFLQQYQPSRVELWCNGKKRQVDIPKHQNKTLMLLG